MIELGTGENYEAVALAASVPKPQGWEFLDTAIVDPLAGLIYAYVRDPHGITYELTVLNGEESTVLTVGAALISVFRAILEHCQLTPRW